VQDYAAWKAAFDGDHALREAGGERSFRVFRTLDDPCELALLFEWESADSFRAYVRSEALQKAQEAAGVVSVPELFLLEEVEQDAVGTR
jgi:heme-degrading monooxygenase HmoA